jgi:molybdopterin-guanine dinucleotide biosynthesis protein B
MQAPRIISFAGWSGSGKMTLITRLIPLLTTRGITVSTIKHAHHAFRTGATSLRDRSSRRARLTSTRRPVHPMWPCPGVPGPNNTV